MQGSDGPVVGLNVLALKTCPAVHLSQGLSLTVREDQSFQLAHRGEMLLFYYIKFA